MAISTRSAASSAPRRRWRLPTARERAARPRAWRRTPSRRPTSSRSGASRDLDEPAAFLSWLRRIVITTALNARRARRVTLLRLDDVPDVPVLDEAETDWTELQRQRLAGALLTLSSEERRLCDRRYHGQWSTARLARDAGVDETAMRKRLQRIRERLRKEIEMSEQRAVRPEEMPADLPAQGPRAAGAAAADRRCRRTRWARSWSCLRSVYAGLHASRSCPRSSTSPTPSGRLPVMRCTSSRTSCSAWTRGASCATTSRCRCC